MKKPNTKKVLLTIWICLAILFFIWNWSTFQSRHLPQKTFSDTFDVQTIETKNQFTFQSNPLTNNPEIIFFQGGLTDPKAYAPLCLKLAENGFTSHLIKTDWRLPQYDYKKVAQLFDLKQRPYVIGGHSQGGKMAAQFVYENPNLLKGLFFTGDFAPKGYRFIKFEYSLFKTVCRK